MQDAGRKGPAAATALLIAVLAGACAHAQPTAVDPAAVETLRRMTAYTAGLEHFRVHTQNTLEDQLESGQRVDFDVAARVSVRRPNKLRAHRVGELIDQQFYYDGTTLAFYRPSDAAYAIEPAPATIEELLDYTREVLGIVIPANDLVYRNAFAIMIEGVTSARVIGTARIGDLECDHLAFSRPDVDFQLWVAKGEKPLPCKLVVTDSSSPAMVSTVSVMSDWDVSSRPPDSEFAFDPPQDAARLEFIKSDEMSAFGR